MPIKYLEAVVLPDGRMDADMAALYIGVPVKTLAQWRWEGKGPPFIKPGRVFYFKKDIDEWLMRGGLLNTSAQARAQVARPPRKRTKAVTT